MNETDRELNREIKDMVADMQDPRRQAEREIKIRIEKRKDFFKRRLGYE